jgi:nucleoside phosphorylase
MTFRLTSKLNVGIDETFDGVSISHDLKGMLQLALRTLQCCERNGVKASTIESIEAEFDELSNTLSTELPDYDRALLEQFFERFVRCVNIVGSDAEARNKRRRAIKRMRDWAADVITDVESKPITEYFATVASKKKQQISLISTRITGALEVAIIEADQLKPALIVASNEREGKVLHAELAKLCGVEYLELSHVKTRYIFRGSFDGTFGSRPIVFVQLASIGLPTALSAFLELYSALKPRVILAVGCCGGLPEKSEKIAPGVVVIPRYIYDYDRQEISEAGTQYAMPPYRTPREIIELARALETADRFQRVTVITNKDYASGSAFINADKAQIRQDIVAKFPLDVVAVEMEGHAVLHGAWELGSQQGDLLVGIVKSVSDMSSGDAEEDKEARQRSAIRNSALVAMELLRELPDD